MTDASTSGTMSPELVKVAERAQQKPTGGSVRRPI